MSDGPDFFTALKEDNLAKIEFGDMTNITNKAAIGG